MKVTALLKGGLYALAAAYVAFCVTVILYGNEFFNFLQSFSPDGEIANRSKVTYTLNLYFLMAASVLFFTRAALSDSVEKPAISNLSGRVKLSYVASLAIILVNIFFHDNKFLHAEDGVMENLTTGLVLVTSVVCLILAIRQEGGIRRLFWLGLMVLLFLFGMEEISWGQRIVGWETPEALAEINIQGESNLHNIFNGVFKLGYIIFSIVICVVVFYRKWLIKFLAKLPLLNQLKVFVPSSEFYYCGFFFMFLAIYTISFFDGGGETMEVVFSVFIFTYTYDMFRKVTAKKATY